MLQAHLTLFGIPDSIQFDSSNANFIARFANMAVLLVGVTSVDEVLPVMKFDAELIDGVWIGKNIVFMRSGHKSSVVEGHIDQAESVVVKSEKQHVGKTLQESVNLVLMRSGHTSAVVEGHIARVDSVVVKNEKQDIANSLQKSVHLEHAADAGPTPAVVQSSPVPAVPVAAPAATSFSSLSRARLVSVAPAPAPASSPTGARVMPGISARPVPTSAPFARAAQAPSSTRPPFNPGVSSMDIPF